MLNIHICTHRNTFICKETTCVSHVNVKGDRGYNRETQAVLKNGFSNALVLDNRHKLKITECEYQCGARKLCSI